METKNFLCRPRKEMFKEARIYFRSPMERAKPLAEKIEKIAKKNKALVELFETNSRQACLKITAGREAIPGILNMMKSQKMLDDKMSSDLKWHNKQSTEKLKTISPNGLVYLGIMQGYLIFQEK